MGNPILGNVAPDSTACRTLPREGSSHDLVASFYILLLTAVLGREITGDSEGFGAG